MLSTDFSPTCAPNFFQNSDNYLITLWEYECWKQRTWVHNRLQLYRK